MKDPKVSRVELRISSKTTSVTVFVDPKEQARHEQKAEEEEVRKKLSPRDRNLLRI